MREGCRITPSANPTYGASRRHAPDAFAKRRGTPVRRPRKAAPRGAKARHRHPPPSPAAARPMRSPSTGALPCEGRGRPLRVERRRVTGIPRLPPPRPRCVRQAPGHSRAKAAEGRSAWSEGASPASPAVRHHAPDAFAKRRGTPVRRPRKAAPRGAKARHRHPPPSAATPPMRSPSAGALPCEGRGRPLRVERRRVTGIRRPPPPRARCARRGPTPSRARASWRPCSRRAAR